MAQTNTYLDVLLNRNQRTHEIEEKDDLIVLRPLNTEDREYARQAFRAIRNDAWKYDGQGYNIVIEHRDADGGLDDYDEIVVRRLDGKTVPST